MYLGRAVDQEGEILDVLVQATRDKRAAVRLMRKLLKKHGLAPREIVTDRLRSCGAAFQELHLSAVHVQGKRKNNRAESSHVPIRRRERRMQDFRSPAGAQRFLSSHAAVYNTFNVCRYLTTAKTHRILRAEYSPRGAMPFVPQPDHRWSVCFLVGAIINVTNPIGLMYGDEPDAVQTWRELQTVRPRSNVQSDRP
jgi:hypothetical protein